MKTIFTIMMVLLTGMSSIYAQLPSPNARIAGGGGTIRGKVRDAQSGQMMEYANIVLLNEKDSSMVDGCITAIDGTFELKNIPFGNYILSVQFVGYTKKNLQGITLNKESNVKDLGLIELSISSSNLAGVEISSEQKTIDFKIDKKVVNVNKDIVASTGSAVDVLRNVPSVQVDAEGNVTVRGSSNFTVLINGRQVSQAANDVLKQTPASTIENIEIITNPSAKYDPDGTAGILNIILKKNRGDGMSGLINASYGTFEKYSTDAQLSVKTGKFNIYAGAEYKNRLDKVTQNIEKTWFTNDTGYNTFSRVDQRYQPWHYKVNLGADWSIDKNNTLSATGTYFRQDFIIESPVSYHIFSEPSTTETWKKITNDLLLKHHWTEGTLNYVHTFKKPGHSLSINGTYNAWRGDKSDEQLSSITDGEWVAISTESQRRRFWDNGSSRISGDIDYTLPVNDHITIEAGYSGDITSFNSKYNVDNFDPDLNSWVTDSSLSNTVDFDYMIHAVYGTMSGEVWGLGYQLGLRGEYFKRDLITAVPDTNYAMEIWSLFPTFHVSKSFKKGHQLMFSYSRRVNRPSVMELNPLPYFSDEYLVHRGNPALRPEYTNSFELSYQKTFGESFISFGTYYRSTEDKMAQIIYIHEGQTQLTNKNVTRDWASGVELMANLSIKKFFRLNVSFDGFYYQLVGDESAGIMSRNIVSANVGLNPTFIFKSGTTIQIQSMYNAPSVDPIGDMKGFFMINAAVKQNFLKGKLSLTLSANNLFNLAKYSYLDENPQYRHHFDYIPEGNVFNIGISYRINNYARRASARQGNGAIDVGF